ASGGAASHERTTGARPRLATRNSDGARRAHPGRAGPPGRGDPARPGQRPAEGEPGHRRGHRRTEIRPPTAATPAGTGVDLAKLGARVRAVGALGDDLLVDIVIAATARD